MPGRMKVFLAQTRKPVPPPVLSLSVPRPREKSMAEKWAEHKREEKKPENESSATSIPPQNEPVLPPENAEHAEQKSPPHFREGV
jgi:hypothetical protein